MLHEIEIINFQLEKEEEEPESDVACEHFPTVWLTVTG
jgi:hypothetical protein